jgi:hypothetical protein
MKPFKRSSKNNKMATNLPKTSLRGNKGEKPGTKLTILTSKFVEFLTLFHKMQNLV